MRRCLRRPRAHAGVTLVLVTVLSGCAWQNELVSTNPAGTDSADGTVSGAWSQLAVSPDGTKVAFATTAGDLGPTDTNGDEDVYVKDLTEGSYTLVSANGDGTDSGSGASYDPEFSPDGTKILFESLAGDLGPTDTNGEEDAYVRDLENSVTSLVSVNASGADSGNAETFTASFGPDGTKVVFITDANDLGPTDSERTGFVYGDNKDAYIRDLEAGTTSLVSVNQTGTDSGNAGTTSAEFSPDGSQVLFESGASDLHERDGDAGQPWEFTDDGIDVFVRDLVGRQTSLVSVGVWGVGGNGGSFDPSFSPDGRKVLFTSRANDLGPGGSTCYTPARPGVPPIPFPCSNVFIRDLMTQTTSLVSVNAWGLGGGSGASGGNFVPQFSPDGTKVVFLSYAEDLTVSEVSGQQIYVRDLVSHSTELVTANGEGTGGGSGLHTDASFDPSGTLVVFSTTGRDFGITDGNVEADVYVRDLAWNVTNPVSINRERTATGDGGSGGGVFTPDGGHVVFWSTASDLVATDTNGQRDVFLASVYVPPSDS